MLPLILGATLGVAGSTAGAAFGGSSGDASVVRGFAGRARSAGATSLLDAGPEGARILRVDEGGRIVSALPLSKTPVSLEPSGLAQSEEGLFWVLADRGHVLIGFDPSSGNAVDMKTLPTACQFVWGVGGVVMVATLPSAGGQPHVLVMRGERFVPCDSLRARPSRGALEASILGIWACGASNTGEVPCWWAAGSSRIHLLGPSCSARTRDVPTLASTRRAAQSSRDPTERYPYPIRDVFQINADRAWVLVNQEGEKTPFDESATVARHVLLVAGTRIERSVALPRKARLVLAGDNTAVTVLYADGTAQRITVP